MMMNHLFRQGILAFFATDLSAAEAAREGAAFEYTQITGNYVDVCAELEAALDDGEEEDTSCENLEKKKCKNNDDCMWTGRASGCKPMPWKKN